jgi:hypothetical protein
LIVILGLVIVVAAAIIGVAELPVTAAARMRSPTGSSVPNGDRHPAPAE